MAENDETKASFVGWDYVPPEKPEREEKPQAEWVKFDKQGDYTFRLVGKVVEFLRHNEPFGKKRIISHASYKDKDPAWKAGFWPRQTYAIHVIDRADGKLKILEKGKSVFDQLFAYKSANPEVDLSGKTSPDFVINVTWPPGDKFQTKYKVTAKAKMNDLTAEELAYAKANKVDLQSLYKATSLENIIKAWEEVPAEKRVYKKRDKKEDGKTASSASKAANSAPIEETFEGAPAGSAGDLFEDNNQF